MISVVLRSGNSPIDKLNSNDKKKISYSGDKRLLIIGNELRVAGREMGGGMG